MSTDARTNRLIHETSPYLLQHAHNPVDWYPWGSEALERARRENKPILVSIGYSACHWCHVMERESFEDPRIAALMNDLFVCVKVDREERPDLDHVYMNAVQMLTGHGGWPLTVFLTPAGEPFFGGTYYPPVDHRGMPGFPRVLQGVAEAYRSKQADVRANVAQLLAGLAKADTPPGEPDRELPPDVAVRAAEALARHYDAEHGGLGRAPKFPNTMVFSLFLRAWHATGETRYRDMTVATLRAMAAGGIYDQLGGGFHRYSTDARWLVPHFEKMLYDNALLVPLYLDGWQVTGDPVFRRVAEETLAYVLREMTHEDGGFFAAQDADSEGVEGKYFVWTPDEVSAVLGAEEGVIFCGVFDVTHGGNFEHMNVLQRVLSSVEASRLFGRDVVEIERIIEEGRAALLAHRSARIPPGRDEKVLTSWNALMISAFAIAYQRLGDVRYREASERAVRFIDDRLTRDGRLLRTWKDGVAKLGGYLDDYAFHLNALVDLFEATFDVTLLERATACADAILERFEDRDAGGFFLTSHDHERLVVRPKPAFDGSVPSGNAAAAFGLLRLFHHRGDPRHHEAAARTLRAFAGGMTAQPFGFGHMIAATDFATRMPREVVIVGAANDPVTRDLLAHIHAFYLPNLTLVVADPSMPSPGPLADGKTQVDGCVTVYVCHDHTCAAPATTWSAVEPLLAPRVGREMVPRRVRDA